MGILIIEYRLAGKRVAQSTGIKVAYRKWDAENIKILGSSQQAEADNDLLDTLLGEAKSACLDLKRTGQPALPGRAKAIALGHQQLEESLLDSWSAWECRQLDRATAGEILPDTARLPARRLPLVKAWLKAEHPAGLLTRELTAARARDFARWLLTSYPTVKTRSFANKCARLLSECAACAVERGALAFHPIGKLKLPKPPKKALTFLTKPQLAQVEEARLANSGLRRTRDAFLLICYTGFSYVDARSFIPAIHITEDLDGQRWILRPRQKTGEPAIIPLLPAAEVLLEKYAAEGQVPVPSNQKMNARLHEIEAELHLPLSLTCHVGRRTFGMLALDAGVSMEAVSKMLGHASIRMTESLYAHVQQGRVGREMREAGLLEHLPARAPVALQPIKQMPRAEPQDVQPTAVRYYTRQQRTEMFVHNALYYSPPTGMGGRNLCVLPHPC
ncbi:MAG: site-specific integrase [Janthinobacterium lividum]